MLLVMFAKKPSFEEIIETLFSLLTKKDSKSLPFVAEAIELIANGANPVENISIKNIRKVRSSETVKARMGEINE